MRRKFAQLADVNSTAAQEWLRREVEQMYQKILDRSKPLEAVIAFETVMQLAEI
jgi:hypothetical protein